MDDTHIINDRILACIDDIKEVWEKSTQNRDTLVAQLNPLTDDLIAALNDKKNGGKGAYSSSSQHLIGVFMADYNKQTPPVVWKGNTVLKRLTKLVNQFRVAFRENPSIPAGDDFDTTLREALRKFDGEMNGYDILLEGTKYYSLCSDIPASTIKTFAMNVTNTKAFYQKAKKILERYSEVWQH